MIMPKLNGYLKIKVLITQCFKEILDKQPVAEDKKKISEIKDMLLFLLDKYQTDNNISIVEIVTAISLLKAINGNKIQIKVCVKRNLYLGIASIINLLENENKEIHPYIFDLDKVKLSFQFKLAILMTKFILKKNKINVIDELKNIKNEIYNDISDHYHKTEFKNDFNNLNKRLNACNGANKLPLNCSLFTKTYLNATIKDGITTCSLKYNS